MTDIQAWLDQGKTLADQATEGPWEADGLEVTRQVPPPNLFRHVVGPIGVIRPENGAFIADARTRLPQALNALQAVLDIHKPIDALNTSYQGGRVQQVCIGCGKDDGNWNIWPCPTVRAIHDALGIQQ